MTPETKNAVITSVQLGDQGRGLSGWLQLDFGGSGQGFGGYSLSGDRMAKWVSNLMRVFEVEDIKDLKGKNCRVIGTHSRLTSIGHIIEDRWFTPEKDLV